MEVHLKLTFQLAEFNGLIWINRIRVQFALFFLYNGFMKSIQFLIKPVSAACNMDCKYCFYKDVHSYQEKVIPSNMLSLETMRALIDQSLPYDDVTFAFQGGEPTLAGLSFYEQFVKEVQNRNPKARIHYSFQTNGLVIDDRWCDFFKRHDVLVGLSLDGPQEYHDYFRPIGQKKSYTTILKNIEMLKKHQIRFNILTVLTSTLSKHPVQYFRWIKELDFRYVQLVPCLPPLGTETSPYSLKPKQFAHFYKVLFRLWFKEFRKGNYFSISFFDNWILLLQGRTPFQCGMMGQCTFQNIIESDGSVYPCDFYAFDQWRCGNIKDDSIESIQNSPKAQSFLHRESCSSEACLTCPYIEYCHQNCRRCHMIYYDQKYCGLRDFLDESFQTLLHIAKTI